MAGEALGELAMIAVNDETLEELGNKMDKVTKRFSYFRIVVLPLFLIGWGIYFLWFN
jgi:predicted transporter|tara:strand:+ start:1466 stop:1636 length:171 start_codon:yes stop_codon:yes gene_type:complete